jgi:hypothetical protein
MRAVLPAAVAEAALADGGTARFVTILPGAQRAWRQADGTPVVALQPQHGSDDMSRDLGNALVGALAAEPGQPGAPAPLGAPGPRIQELLDPAGPTSFEVRDAFDFWKDLDPEDESLATGADQSKEELAPTEAVEGLVGGFWSRFGSREFLRWSMGLEEDPTLDALARLQARREAGVMDGAKYAGAFRELGLVIPVWDLPRGTEAAAVAEPAQAFKARFDEALAVTEPLDAAERRARAGLVARSVTLR